MVTSSQDKMKGKRVLVTGAGTGIGRGVAVEFAREGAAVALHYSQSGKGAESAAGEIRKAGGKAKAFQADFRTVAPVRQLAQEVLGYLGGLDVLVNNAGITMNRVFEQVTEEQYDTLYNVNVRAQFFLTQALVPALGEAGKGVVINLTSNHAFFGLREHSVYAGTKGAIVSYSRELALDLAPRGIRVNAIAPGWILVENHLKVEPGLDVEAAGSRQPAGILGDPVDVARLAIFLASEESRYIIGQTLLIDGGTSAIMPLTGDFQQPMGVQFGQGYVPGLRG